MTVGRARTFLELLRFQIRDVMLDLVSHDLDAAYGKVRPVDFSREVLTALPNRLLVADLGNPARVVDTLTRNRIEPAWLREITLK